MGPPPRVYFSIRKPTADDRHGARPPAVRSPTYVARKRYDARFPCKALRGGGGAMAKATHLVLLRRRHNESTEVAGGRDKTGAADGFLEDGTKRHGETSTEFLLDLTSEFGDSRVYVQAPRRHAKSKRHRREWTCERQEPSAFRVETNWDPQEASPEPLRLGSGYQCQWPLRRPSRRPTRTRRTPSQRLKLRRTLHGRESEPGFNWKTAHGP